MKANLINGIAIALILLVSGCLSQPEKPEYEIRFFRIEAPLQIVPKNSAKVNLGQARTELEKVAIVKRGTPEPKDLGSWRAGVLDSEVVTQVFANKYGIEFPERCFALYLQHFLVVTNTPENLDRIESVIAPFRGEWPEKD